MSSLYMISLKLPMQNGTEKVSQLSVIQNIPEIL